MATRPTTTPSPLRVTSGRIVKKYQRIRARSSPLNDTVRRRLLAKITGAAIDESHSATIDDSSTMAEMESQELSQSVHENIHKLSVDSARGAARRRVYQFAVVLFLDAI